ncbi:MAG: nickel-dependent lactate racemase [Chloroflexi bacterium]|nr:nickel-dependent lactate racemase [Chloroflexota bacterium]
MENGARRVRLPYGRGWQDAVLPASARPETLRPAENPSLADPASAIRAALQQPLSAAPLHQTRARRTAIAINDNTRPTPHDVLLPPLLEALHAAGLAAQDIHLYLAGGTHRPMSAREIEAMLPREIVSRYPIHSHDSEDADQLIHLGMTKRGTPILCNAAYLNAELRLVVGILAPHQFMGFGGGVKGAAIGLAGNETIHQNHALMLEEGAEMGRFSGNPAREDVEEIGARIGIHFVLNVTLNNERGITQVFAGEPQAVMRSAIPQLKARFLTRVTEPFDLMLASPGGHPKDLNLYQAQKGLYHASRVTKEGPTGALLICAACPDGSGSLAYENWLSEQQPRTQEEVLQRFHEQPFRVGPHKAFQIAREATRMRVIWVTQLPADLCRRGLLETAPSLQSAIDRIARQLPASPRVGVMPLANDTIAEVSNE